MLKKKKRKYKFVSRFIFLMSNKNGFLQTRYLLPKPGPGFPNTPLKTCYQVLQTLHNKDVVFVHVVLQSKRTTEGPGSIAMHWLRWLCRMHIKHAADYQLKQLLFSYNPQTIMTKRAMKHSKAIALLVASVEIQENCRLLDEWKGKVESNMDEQWIWSLVPVMMLQLWPTISYLLAADFLPSWCPNSIFTNTGGRINTGHARTSYPSPKDRN